MSNDNSTNKMPSSKKSPIKTLARFFIGLFGWFFIISGFVVSAILIYLITHPGNFNVEIIDQTGAGNVKPNTYLILGLFLSIGVFVLGLFIVFYIHRLAVSAKAKSSLEVLSGKREITDKEIEAIADGDQGGRVGIIRNLPQMMAIGKRKWIRLLEPVTLEELYRLLTEQWDVAKPGKFYLGASEIWSNDFNFGKIKIEVTDYFDLLKFGTVRDRMISIDIIPMGDLPAETQKEQYVKAIKIFLDIRTELVKILGSRVNMKYE